MQTKQHATKKPNSFSNRNNYRGLLFVEGGSWAENVQNLQEVFIDSISWNCIQHIFNSRGAVFLMC